MSRIKVTQGGELVGWFDPQKATAFQEGQWHDGNNFISKATGSQTEHECLYYTASGKWILNSWSQFQGSRETHELISETEAGEWFIKNEYEDHELENLPEKVRNQIQQTINEGEL